MLNMIKTCGLISLCVIHFIWFQSFSRLNFLTNPTLQVRFSQLVGKNILLFFEGSDFQQKTVDLLLTLEAMYLEKKDTRDEFEVIYITKCKKESRYNELIPFMTWFVSPESELSPVDLSLYLCYCHLEERTCSHRELSSILAFDRDGRVVRKSLAVSFSFDHINFPFYAGNMQMEVYSDLNLFYGWWELDYYHYGLLINSYDINGYLPCVQALYFHFELDKKLSGEIRCRIRD